MHYSIYIYIHTHICMYIYIYIYMYAHTYTLHCKVPRKTGGVEMRGGRPPWRTESLDNVELHMNYCDNIYNVYIYITMYIITCISISIRNLTCYVNI